MSIVIAGILMAIIVSGAQAISKCRKAVANIVAQVISLGARGHAWLRKGEREISWL